MMQFGVGGQAIAAQILDDGSHCGRLRWKRGMSSLRSRSIASRTTQALDTRFFRASASKLSYCSLGTLTENLRICFWADSPLTREDISRPRR